MKNRNSLELPRFQTARRNAAMPAFADAMALLRKQAEEALEVRFTPGKQDRGEWSHHYYCTEDAARLVFDWEEPRRHRCPVCSKVYAGELYDSVWVTVAHDKLARGAKAMAFLHALEDRRDMLERVTTLLLEYAEWYELWEIHGDVPYNGPGKLFAQTLDEAHWIMNLGLAYAFARNGMPEPVRSRIEEGLFRPCARFLIDHMEKQMHNHAVLITSAISMIGYLLDDPELLQAGLDGTYGLKSQLEHGVLEDGFWYEGVFHYHFYAFAPILDYGLLVEGTGLDISRMPVIRSMFDFTIPFVLPDGSFTKRNDATTDATMGSYAPFYEIGLAWYQDDRYRTWLRAAYGMELPECLTRFGYEPVRRDSLFALLFGESLEDPPVWYGASDLHTDLTESYSSGPSGLTKLANGSGMHLTVKHSPFGGEHDHMDQINLSWGYGGTPVMADAGTVSYALPLHYGWFKHTYSHNTVSLNGKDQPPADGRRLGFGREPWGSWVAVSADWNTGRYRMMDRIIMPEELRPWDMAAYRGAELVRVCILTGAGLLDVVRVTVPEARRVELLYHINGRLEEESGGALQEEEISFCDLPGQRELFLNPCRLQGIGNSPIRFRLAEGELMHEAWCSREAELLTASTPGTGAGSKRQTVVQRLEGTGVVHFVNRFTLCGENAEGRNGGLGLKVRLSQDGEIRIQHAGLNGDMVILEQEEQWSVRLE